MIELSHVTKVYGGTHTAVNNCSFQVEDGKITGFIGPNGAGKTTTLKMITGILEPTDGQILLDGTDIQRNPLEAKKKIGFVSDNPDNFLRLKGLEYLNFMADIYDVPQAGRMEKIQAMAKRVEIEDVLGDKILGYSQGLRQKVMVMGALIHDPSLWILDEPMTGLDPRAAFELKEMMREHAQSGHAVLFSTHVLEVAEKLCDQGVIINKGQIVFQGTLDQLRADYPEEESLEDIFLAVTEHA